jgi:signal transduction histidine kinase
MSRNSLSTRLLILILLFSTLSGVLIHVPSVARFRASFLEHRVIDAYIAMLPLLAKADNASIDPGLEQALLEQVQALGIELRDPRLASPLTLGQTFPTNNTLDLRKQTLFALIWESLVTLLAAEERVIRIIGAPPRHPQAVISVFINEWNLHNELYFHAKRAITLSLLISLVTAMLVYLSLQWLLVRSIHRITHNLVDFRKDPESSNHVIQPTGRRDEIGIMERELAHMQTELHSSLRQRSRLAALGTAVSKIHHDLKTTLSTVSIASERLAKVDDPTVQRVTPLLVDSVERAVYLCSQTQDLARGEQTVLKWSRFPLRDLVDDVGQTLRLDSNHHVNWQNQVDSGLIIKADVECLYRVLLNLGRNAVEAMADHQGNIRIIVIQQEQDLVLDMVDDGPGIPETVREHLFQPFIGSHRPGGMGLGLAISRDLIRAHGGDLVLLETGSSGTHFRLTIPRAVGN